MAKTKTKKKKPRIAQAVHRGITTRSFPYNPKPGTAYHWTYVLRAKRPDQREAIARGMERAVKRNNLIKYSNESDKNAALYDQVKPRHYDPLKVTKKTTTNCCNLVSVACNWAGIHTPRKSSATTLPKKWVQYGFKVIPYKHGKTKLLRGDILDANIKPKVHTAVYLG